MRLCTLPLNLCYAGPPVLGKEPGSVLLHNHHYDWLGPWASGISSHCHGYHVPGSAFTLPCLTLPYLVKSDGLHALDELHSEAEKRDSILLDEEPWMKSKFHDQEDA